jgi:hypothetical protein
MVPISMASLHLHTPIPVRPDVIDARYVSFVDAAGLRVLLAERSRRDCALRSSLVIDRLVTAAGIDVPASDDSFGLPRGQTPRRGVRRRDRGLHRRVA